MSRVKLFITYDINVMTSYQVSDWCDKIFGRNKVIVFDEVRDGLDGKVGYLKGFDVEVEIDG